MDKVNITILDNLGTLVVFIRPGIKNEIHIRGFRVIRIRVRTKKGYFNRNTNYRSPAPVTTGRYRRGTLEHCIKVQVFLSYALCIIQKGIYKGPLLFPTPFQDQICGICAYER